jgi:hypothetical protein
MAELVIDSVSPVDNVVERLDARGHEWRESTLPAVLRTKGVYGLRIRRNGHAFRIQCEGGGRRPYVPVLVGRVTPRPDGCQVRAHFQPSVGTVVSLGLWSAWLIGLTLAGGGLFILIPGLLLTVAMQAFGVAASAAEREGLHTVLRDIVDPRADATHNDALESASRRGAV